MKQYGSRVVVGLVWATVGLAAVPTQAQAQAIYRCGNEYTNNARLAKEKGCKAVEGGHVTVIHDSGNRAAASATPSAPQAGSGAPRGAPPRSDGPEQRARDGDAKAILQSELDKANAKLASLKAEYNNGNPDRTALELRNPQGYPERVEALKANIARQESDIAGIQRELARLP